MIEAAVKHTARVFAHGRKLFVFFSAELSAHYSEEKFNTPVAQDPADLIEDAQVTLTKAALREDGDTELESASEKQ